MWTAATIAAIGIAIGIAGLLAFGRSERLRGAAETGKKVMDQAEKENRDAKADLRATRRRFRAVWRRVRDGSGR